MKQSCIFRLRCKSCHLLTLHSEKHICGIPKGESLLVKRIWKLLNKFTRATASSLAFTIFGKLRNKEFTRIIRIIINKNQHLFTYYYLRGTNYYCTRTTKMKLKI